MRFSYLNKAANELIQTIFDYYKHPQHLNPDGIHHLVKILATFYHNNLYVTFSQDCIEIPYKINECYLIPNLNYGGKQYIHDNEGSFISALLKILKAFEDKLQEQKKLSKQEEHQLHYIIYALFDFLPLPHDAKEKKKIPKNPDKIRYSNEPVERLYQVMTNHVLFFMEFYPLFFQHYDADIKKQFCSYVANGVSEDNLLALFKKNDSTQINFNLLVKDLEEPLEKGLDGNKFKEKFTNKGKQKGFARQYGYNDPAEFIEKLEKEVEKLLVRPLNDSAIKEPIQKESIWQANIESYAIDILYLGYSACLHSRSSQPKKFRKFEYFKFLGLDAKKFVDTFSKTYYQEIKQETFILEKLSKNKSKKEVDHKQLDKIVEKISQEGNRELTIFVRDILHVAYDECKPDYKNKDKAELLNIYKELSEIRKLLKNTAEPKQALNESKDVVEEEEPEEETTYDTSYSLSMVTTSGRESDEVKSRSSSNASSNSSSFPEYSEAEPSDSEKQPSLNQNENPASPIQGLEEENQSEEENFCSP